MTIEASRKAGWYVYGDPVHTPLGKGKVIKDCRNPGPHPLGFAYDAVWVLLDGGDNPQRFLPSEVTA